MVTVFPPLLVTGAHRSGTTWVGKMLACDSHTAYVSEPLNVLHRPGVYRASVRHWYQYICDENEQEYLPAFHQLLNLKYQLLAQVRALRSTKDFLRMGRDFAISYSQLKLRQRVLLKDPFAIFSAAWFAKKLRCRVIIVVRHPAAFVSSLQRLQWHFDFNNLLAQSLLMRDHLETYREDMSLIEADDIIGQASLLWKMIYASIQSARESNPDLIIVRHEDLSRDPVNGFRDLYARLGLEFSPRVLKTIETSSGSANPTELSRNQTHSVKLDSVASINNWRKRLSQGEVTRIRALTEGVSHFYYSDREWGPEDEVVRTLESRASASSEPQPTPRYR